MRMLSTASSNCTLSLWVLAYITFCFMKLIYKTYHSNKGQGRHHNTGYKEMRPVQNYAGDQPAAMYSLISLHQQSTDHALYSLISFFTNNLVTIWIQVFAVCLSYRQYSRSVTVDGRVHCTSWQMCVWSFNRSLGVSEMELNTKI